MLKWRPFQLFVTALVALGLHLCCCHLPLLSREVKKSGNVGERSCKSLCSHGHDEAGDGAIPAHHDEAPHGCCGVHDKPLTSQVTKIVVPPLTWVALPTLVPTVVEPADLNLTTAGVQSGAPKPQTSLVRRHCALVI